MSSRIPALDPINATGPTAELFTAVKSKLGMVPNLMRTLGQSPAALDAYLSFSGKLAAGVLPAKVREQIALAVAETNACDYCLAAHSLIGKGAGLSVDAILAARRVSATEPKTDALLKFAAVVVESRGLVSDDAIAAVRAAGATDAEIIETVAHVALNILTNYTNHVAQTVVDFPKATALPVGV
ncbi:MAG: carboxymuconolactone decarboxylase family protein [Opitutae bacterium]